VIFGLTFATFLTLVIVPVMYLLVEKIRLLFVKR
jgi:multidrug efflux pump